MMMHVLRPVRASASRLLATPTGTNSTVDYQQQPHAFAPNDSGGSFGAVQQPSPGGLQASPGNFGGDGWGNTQCTNLPVIWPMHSVFNATSGPNDGQGISVATDEPTMLMVPSTPMEVSTQAPNGSVVGGTVWLQPVLWPVFRPCGPYEGMQMSGTAVQLAPFNALPEGVGMLPMEACPAEPETFSQQCVASQDSPPLVVAGPAAANVAVENSEGPSMVQQAEKSQGMGMALQAEKPQGAGRRQRRSKRGGVAAKGKAPNAVDTAALFPDEVEELRLAVKTAEAGLRSRDSPYSSERSHSLDQASRPNISWADIIDEDEIEPQQQLPISPALAREAVYAEVPDRSVAASRLMETCVDLEKTKNVDDVTALQEDDLIVDPMLLELDNIDGANFRSTIDDIVTSVWPLALTKRGCRIVQKAMEVGTSADQQQIVDKLHGRVQEALRSPHANHVLQKCIEIMPPHQTQFVLLELKGEGAFASRHRFGCRIVQRLIEHCAPWQTEELISEVLADTARLCRHQYGNFVIQHILQHGSPAQRHVVAEVLCEDTIRLAKHRIASHVLSCAMVHCEAEDVKKLTKVVLHDAGQLADLSRRQYGSFVVREVNRAARQFA